MSRIIGFVSGVVVGALGTNWFYTQGSKKLTEKKAILKENGAAFKEKAEEIGHQTLVKAEKIGKELKQKGEELKTKATEMGSAAKQKAEDAKDAISKKINK